MNKTTNLALALLLASGTLAQAQFGGLGGLMSKKDAAPSMDTDAVLANGAKLIIFSTIATDLAVHAAKNMLEAFPPAKVAAIKAKFAKYDELKALRADKDQLDADSCTAASDAFDELAKLDMDGYDKKKSKVVVPAYTQIGLAVGADALAATQVPAYVSSAQATVKSLASNPMQLNKLNKVRIQLVVAQALASNTPRQIKAMKTVRAIAKHIADAEHYKLGEPKIPTTLDTDALSKESKAEEVDG